MFISKSRLTVNSNIVNNTSDSVYFICTDVLSNKAEDRLLDYLINTSEQNLLTIPAAHHLGEPIHVKISLGLKKIIKVV